MKMSAQLGLVFSNPRCQAGDATRVGGAALLSTKETMPKCSHCKHPMTLILHLNHDVLPLAGMMHSAGVSRVFACIDSTCSSRIETEVLQTTRSLSPVENGAGLLFQERGVVEQQIVEEESELNKYGITIQRKEKSTTLIVNLRQLGIELKFFDGRDVDIVTSFVLKDKAKGIKMSKMTRLSDESSVPVNVHSEEKIPSPGRGPNSASRRREVSPRQESPVVRRERLSLSPTRDTSFVGETESSVPILLNEEDPPKATGTYSAVLKAAVQTTVPPPTHVTTFNASKPVVQNNNAPPRKSSGRTTVIATVHRTGPPSEKVKQAPVPPGEWQVHVNKRPSKKDKTVKQ